MVWEQHPNIKDKVIIITGASSGIGAAAASELVLHGANVMIAARREDRLKRLVGEIGEKLEEKVRENIGEIVRCQINDDITDIEEQDIDESVRQQLSGEIDYKVTDVTHREQVDDLVKATIEKFGHVDVLVNNAGVMPLSYLDKGKVDEWDRMIDVNIKGVLYGINAVLGHMLERGKGQIINIASVAGHHVWPSGAVYCGTKFAVRAISEGLRQETAGKIRVTIISPGIVETELRKTITDEDVLKNISSSKFKGLDASSIANAIRYAIEQPEDVAINEILVRPSAQR